MKSPVIRRLKFKLSSKIARLSFLKLILIALIILFFFIFIDIYNNTYKPQITKIAEAKANYILTDAVNDGINSVITKNELNYHDIISYIKDDDGRVSLIMTNLVVANRLKSEFSLSINEKINKLKEVNILVPLGSLTKIDTLAGLGPKISIRLIPSGKVIIDFKNAFSEAGINQTKHEIFLEVVSTASIFMPTGIYTKATVTSKIPLCESIIIGRVPESITRLETRDETLRDDILNIY